MSRTTHPDGLPSPQAMSRTIDRKIAVVCAVVVAVCASGFFALNLRDRYVAHQAAVTAEREQLIDLIITNNDRAKPARRVNRNAWEIYKKASPAQQKAWYPNGFDLELQLETPGGKPIQNNDETDEDYRARVRAWVYSLPED